jgi:hypothetical protein
LKAGQNPHKVNTIKAMMKGGTKDPKGQPLAQIGNDDVRIASL